MCINQCFYQSISQYGLYCACTRHEHVIHKKEGEEAIFIMNIRELLKLCLTGLFLGFCWLVQFVLMHAAFTAARNCAICLSNKYSDGAGTTVEFGRLYICLATAN